MKKEKQSRRDKQPRTGMQNIKKMKQTVVS